MPKNREEWCEYFAWQIAYAVQPSEQPDEEMRIGLCHALGLIFSKSCYAILGIHDESDQKLGELTRVLLEAAQDEITRQHCKQISSDSESDCPGDNSSDG